MIDVERLARESGWRVVHRARVGSTNEQAARLRDAGAGARVAVVADVQDAGRGRGGRAFASPRGGLYVSLLVDARPNDLPGALTAAIALAAAEAVEAVAGVGCGIKWPNDLWVGRRKLGGILLEAAGNGLPVVAGIGLNLRDVPPELAAATRLETTALDGEAGRRISRGALLGALLARIDAHLAQLGNPAGRTALAEAWRARLLLVGERITYVHGGRAGRGRLLGADLEEGLWIEDDAQGRVHCRSEHVHDVRPCP